MLDIHRPRLSVPLNTPRCPSPLKSGSNPKKLPTLFASPDQQNDASTLFAFPSRTECPSVLAYHDDPSTKSVYPTNPICPPTLIGGPQSRSNLKPLNVAPKSNSGGFVSPGQ